MFCFFSVCSSIYGHDLVKGKKLKFLFWEHNRTLTRKVVRVPKGCIFGLEPQSHQKQKTFFCLRKQKNDDYIFEKNKKMIASLRQKKR